MKFLHLIKSDIQISRDLINLFGDVFEDTKSFNNSEVNDDYLQSFLADENHIVVVALSEDNTVVGGLVAYQLDKFEKKRKELYIFDLAVLESKQRQVIGTHLINEVIKIAKQRNISVIFVQADEEDTHAISFYRKIFTKELIAHHFELEVDGAK